MRNNEEIMQLLERLKADKKMSLREISRKTDIAVSSISRYFNRTRDFPLDKLDRFAKAFNVSPEYILNVSKPCDITTIYNQLHEKRQAKVYNYAREQLDEQLNDKSSIYVVGTSAAGEPIEYGDFDSEMIQTDVPAKADKAIHIKGDSMEPKIASNSIIFYHEQPTLEIGEIGIFEINGSAVTCKKYYVDYESKKIILKSINPKYEPMYFARDQVRILGKVVF